MHPLLAQVFRAFDEADIAWLVLRDELELATPEGDVDLLVEERGAARAHPVLRSLGFVRVPTSGRGSHVFYFRYHAADDRWFKLDIVTELAFGPYLGFRTGAADGCLARRRTLDGVAALAPDDAFWALILHGLLDKRTFQPRRAKRLQDLASEARPDTPWARAIGPICPPAWTLERIIDAVVHGDWTALEDLGPNMEAMWTRRDRSGVAVRNITGRIRRFFEKPLVFLTRPGFTVALLGPDGTGKSTVATSIAQSFPFPTRKIYMGLWQGPPRRRPPFIPGADLLGRLAFAWRRYLIGQLHRARGRLVLFDRYSYDAMLGPGDRLSRRERLYLSLIARSCPAPDLVLVLDVPGEVAYARKGEHDVAHLERDRRRFLALADHIPHLEIVDADRPAETVCREVTARIWERYQARWRR